MTTMENALFFLANDCCWILNMCVHGSVYKETASIMMQMEKEISLHTVDVASMTM